VVCIKNLIDHSKLLLSIIGILIIIEVADFLIFHGSLDRFGIQPRDVGWLPGILFAPFLHGGFVHLANNSVPFFVLGLICIAGGKDEFYTVIVFTILVSGIGTWLVGSYGSVHIGASGVVFGLFGYLLLRGFFTRKVIPVLISIGVALTYGGMIYGVLPNQPGVSWEAHLFGFVGGVLCAYLMANRIKRKVVAYRIN
jgi:membrane associated rhomboid family serine protease